MHRIAFLLAATAALCVARPNEVLAQKVEHVVTLPTPAAGTSQAARTNSATSRMVIGGIVGGVIGGAITAGCLYLSGMGAVHSLPYCIVPAVAGVAFGAWVGANMGNGREPDDGPAP